MFKGISVFMSSSVILRFNQYLVLKKENKSLKLFD